MRKIRKLSIAMTLFAVLFAFPASAVVVDGVSDSSTVESFASWLISLFVTNNNNAILTNNVTSSGNSGGNNFVSSDDQQNTQLTTGDSRSATLVENSANNNFVSQEYESSEGADHTITEVSDSSVASVSQDDTLTNNVTNNNDVRTTNNVDASADTGNNLVSSGDSLKDSSAATGIADAVTGVSNLFNFNLNNIIRRIRSVIAP